MVILIQYCHGYQRQHDIPARDVEVHSNQSYNFGQYPFLCDVALHPLDDEFCRLPVQT